MKSILKKVLFALSLLVVFYSCSKDEDSPDDEITTADVSNIEATVKSGDWKITYYFDTDKEETSNYDGYSFTFNADGSLVATDGNTAVSGAWSITDSSSSSDDDIDFNIFFTAPDIFEELADDWDIQKYTSSKIELIDVSGGNGETDYLTFEKK